MAARMGEGGARRPRSARWPRSASCPDEALGLPGVRARQVVDGDTLHEMLSPQVLLRGGSNYRPAGSHWYFPNRAGPGAGAPCTTHNKYMLFGEVYERAGTIGFRCVYDAE